MFYCFSGYLKKHGKARRSSRSFRKEPALRTAANLPGQTRLENYFETLADLIDNDENTRIPINSIIGADKTSSDKPILRKMLRKIEVKSQLEALGMMMLSGNLHHHCIV